MSDLVYEKHDSEHYALFTMDRPDRLNAIGRQMSIDQQNALADFNNDPNMWVAILTGTGRAFSAGADLKEMAERNNQISTIEELFDSGTITSEERNSKLKEWTQHVGPGSFSSSPKPIIAAINGIAQGGGMERAMDCDIRIASTNATFGLPEVKRGVLAGYAINHFGRVSHYGEAMYYILTGETMPADEALRIGFVHELLPPDRLMPRAVEIAANITANAPLAVQATKKVMQFWRRLAMEESQNYSNAIYSQVNKTADAKEGPRAFAEKRPPKWLGR